MCGGFAAFTNTPLLAQVTAIENITAQQEGRADENQY
jgi:hypothetical protein